MATFSLIGSGDVLPEGGSPVAFTVHAAGIGGTIANVAIEVSIFTDSADDFDMLLVGPDGQHNLLFLSDAGMDAFDGIPFNANSYSLLFIDDADEDAPDDALFAPDGVYRPADYGDVESEADFGTATGGINRAGPNGTGTFRSAFGGLNPNGDWTLVVRDDRKAGAFTGSEFLNSFTVLIETDDDAAIINGGAGGDVLINSSVDADPGFVAGFFTLNGDSAVGSAIVYAGTEFRFNGGGGNDTYIGSAGAETANGDDGNDRLIGGKGNDVLNGGAGDDSLVGGGDNDTLIGGAGDDTAEFNVDLGSVKSFFQGGTLFIESAEGRDALTGIEHIVFLDGKIDVGAVLDGNPLVDDLFYLGQNKDVWAAGIDADTHYNMVGFREGRDPNAFFDVSGYLAVNKDVPAGMDPLAHYDQFGWRQGRDPSADFDTKLYLVHNPDVAAAGMNPLLHYLQFGRAEGRQAYAAIGQNISGGFDAEYYLFHNPDVAAAGIDPLMHYNAVGWHEGRNPNAYFDTAGYLSHYTDVAAAGINPLQHYETTGWKEGRDPSAGFDTQGYLAANPDVAAAGINPLDHYMLAGIYEGRAIVNDGLWH
jgi:Ca2+-binding RTX toxin-like protein